MKKITLFLLFYVGAFSFSYAQCSGGDSPYEPELMYKYWQLRDRFDQHFIHADLDENGDLTGDGIGTWDAVNNRYTKAGYSLPIINLLMDDRDNDGTNVYDPPSSSLMNSEGASGIDNIMAVGADNTYAMGMYIAMLSTEYGLLRKQGISTKKTENELFLALQALRRLDMTANQLAAAVCDCDAAIFNLNPNTTGYSGFMVRLDTPADFHPNLDNPNDTDCWRVGGVRSLFADADYYENLPCNFRDLEYRNRIAGQDQIIGMLFGLAFVKKFIPPVVTISYGGTDYNLLAMAQSISFGLVNRIGSNSNRTIKYPSCPLDVFQGGAPRVPNDDGGDATAYYYGMNKLLDYIMPGNGVPSSLGDYLVWQGAITLVVNDNQPNDDNQRMAIELMAASNTNFGDKAKKYALRCGNLNLMQYFAWAVLHDKDLDTDQTDDMEDILCSLGCEGPCFTRFRPDANGVPRPTWDGPRFDCTSSMNVSNRWCTGERWKHSCNKLRLCQALTYGEKQSGYDYMLAYNLYHLYALPNTPFFNPFEVLEKDSHEEYIDQLTGESSLCSGQTFSYCVPPDVASSLDEIEWSVSENLYSPDVGTSTLDCIDVSPASGNTTGSGWVRAIFNDGTCKYAYQKNIQIGSPDHNAIVTIYNEACPYSLHVAIQGESTTQETYSWQVVVPPGVYYSPTTLDEDYLNITTNNTLGGAFIYNVTITNECGTEVVSGHLQIPEKKCDGGWELLISPNPVSYDLHVELGSALDDPFKDGGTGQFYLYDQYSNMRRTFDMTSRTKTVNVSDLPNGLYFISGQVGGEQVTSQQFVIQHSK